MAFTLSVIQKVCAYIRLQGLDDGKMLSLEGKSAVQDKVNNDFWPEQNKQNNADMNSRLKAARQVQSKHQTLETSLTSHG